MKYTRVYEMLKHLGHSASQALVIIHDARRKSEFALSWIRICRGAYRAERRMENAHA